MPHPGEGVSAGSPSRSASAAHVRPRSRSPSKHRFPGRGGEHRERRPGVEVSARAEGGLGPLAHAGRRATEGLADERGDDPQAQLGIGLCLGVEGPGDRGAEVVELGVETREPRGLVGSFQAGPGRFGEAGVVLGVAAAILLGLAGVVEAFERILAQRLEQPKARGAIGTVVEDDHRLRGQVIEGVAHIPGRELVARPRPRSAASASKLPANTPRRSKIVRSRSSSNE